MVFAADGEGGRAMLWLRPLDRTTAEALEGTDGATYPFWAPDGRAIGFFAGGQLKRIDLAGGVPRVIADAPDGRGGTWNDDGVIVFTPSPAATGLMRVAAEGGMPEPFTELTPGEGSHRWPQFLPDGRRVLFLMTLGQPQTHGVYVASLDGGEPTRVMAGEIAALFAPPGHLLHVSQGVLFAQSFDPASATVSAEPIPVAEAVGTDDGTFRSAVSVSSAGVLAYRAGLAGTRRQLVWVNRMGAEQGAIGEPDEMTLSSPALSSDGRRAAVYRNVQGNLDIWLMDLSRGVPSRFTFDGAVDAFPIWSPDATQVAFLTGRNGNQLFVKAADGASDEQPLLTTERQSMPLDWSPDGLLLYATEGSTSTSDLWALPLAGGGEPFAVVETRFDDIQGELSPDGRWLAYASNESGRYEVYVQAFPESGGKWQVSLAGGLQPRWRRDGEELFFVAPDARLMATPVRVATDGRSVDVGAPVALFPTRLARGAGIPQTGVISRPQYAVARDGRFLMNVAVDEEAPTPPITIVQNWTAALEP